VHRHALWRQHAEHGAHTSGLNVALFVCRTSGGELMGLVSQVRAGSATRMGPFMSWCCPGSQENDAPAISDAHAVRHDGDAMQAGLPIEEHNVAVVQMSLHNMSTSEIHNSLPSLAPSMWPLVDSNIVQKHLA